jgi:hypothetical protein
MMVGWVIPFSGLTLHEIGVGHDAGLNRPRRQANVRGCRARAQGSEGDILENYPGITHDDILACLAYARDTLSSEKVFPSAA